MLDALDYPVEVVEREIMASLRMDFEWPSPALFHGL